MWQKCWNINSVHAMVFIDWDIDSLHHFHSYHVVVLKKGDQNSLFMPDVIISPLDTIFYVTPITDVCISIISHLWLEYHWRLLFILFYRKPFKVASHSACIIFGKHSLSEQTFSTPRAFVGLHPGKTLKGDSNSRLMVTRKNNRLFYRP